MPAILAAAVVLLLVFGQSPPEQAPHLTVASPVPSGPIGSVVAQVTVDVRRLDAIEPLVRDAIAEKKLPGAVVLVGRGDRILYQKAIGNRALVPAAEPMTLDTVFDLASLTKVVATTTSVMMLVEQGRIRLNDRVSSYIPGFERYGKGDITIRHLLTHVSGLRPDVDLADPWMGYETAIALAVDEVPTSRPGERFVYSDINFFLLGDVVQRVSGLSLDKFAHEHIFDPLGMKDTMFNPPASLVSRVAPTESCTRFGWPCQGPEMTMLRGVVHDPTARRMGGVAGHAGLFSTASDLATFCRMLLGGGAFQSARILSPLAVEKMTSAASPDLETNTRGLGWDIDSAFSSNRGELLPVGSFGHTGFTGTSVWIDPSTGMFVVFLSNRVHPDGKGDVTPLRARVATVAAAAVTGLPPAARAAVWTGRDFGASGTVLPRPSVPVLTGIDVLRAEGFVPLRGKRVGLVTNHTGLARDGASTIDVLFGAKDVRLVALFSPEHGIRGTLDDKVASSTDEKTRLPIYSLYGETRRPTPAMLDGLEALVVDLQDIGARFYTYTTTMAYVLEEAAKRRLPVIVLDRPNPINGFQIEGPALDKAQVGFTGYLRADADSARAHDRGAGAALQRREQDRRGADRHCREELAARRVVRRDGAAVDQSVSEHAEPDSGDPLSGDRLDRNDQHLGRARHGYAVRAGGGSVDRGDSAGRVAQRSADPGGQVLPGPVHARLQQVRGTGVSGRVPDCDGSDGAPPGAARGRNRGDAPQGVRSDVRARFGGTALWLPRGHRPDPRRGGPGGDCRLVDSGGSAVEAAPSAVSPVSLSSYGHC